MSTVEQPDWFAVQVVSRRELAVAAALREKGYEDFVPLQDERSRGRRENPKALFPGYVFCRMNDDIVSRMCTTPGFVRIVGFGDRPAPIPIAEIDAIRRALAAGLYVRPADFYQAGDLVRVLEGPLAGVEGRFVRHAARSSLVLSVKLLQRAVSVQVDADSVERIAHEGGR